MQYIYPNSDKNIKKPVKVYQHNLDDTHVRTDYKDIYGNDGGVYLKLVKIAHQNHHYLKEIKISSNAKKIDFVLSQDNNMLAISYVEDNMTYIKVLSCKDNKVVEMFENFENNVFSYEYKEYTTFI